MSVAQVGAGVSPEHCDQYPAIAHLSLSESVKCHVCISLGGKGTCVSYIKYSHTNHASLNKVSR